MNPQAATWDSHHDIFLAPSPDVRGSTLGTTARDTNTMTLLIRSGDQRPCCKRLRSPPQHGGESARVVPWMPVARCALHP